MRDPSADGGGRNRRGSLVLATIGAVAVVALTAGIVAFLQRPGGGDAPTTHPGSADPLDLVALTRDAPCPFGSGAQPGTRDDLEKFHAVAAFNCTESDRTFPGEGEWTVETRQATDQGIAALVSAFEQPNQSQPPGDAACSAVGYGPLVTLVDQDGRSFVPQAPSDACGEPLASVRRMVKELHWQTVGTRRVSQVATPDALAAGCTMQVKNVVVIDSRSHIGASPGGPVLVDQPDAPLDICVYRAGGDLTVGTFTRGMRLDTADSAGLRAALTGAGPSRTCADTADFATVTAQGGGTVFLELGGCWRLERNDGGRTTLGAVSDVRTVQDLLGPN
jgi:hypothetical protein